MIDPIAEIRKQSRLFNEPPPPKPTAESLAAEIEAVFEELHDTALNLRRLESKLILVANKLKNLETIQKP